jgi:hypothetical protein
MSVDLPQSGSAQADRREDVAVRLRSLLLGPDGSESLLSDLACWAAGEVEDASSCGITLSGTTGTQWMGASSDELAKRMDAIQYVLEVGPCLTCIRQRIVVRIADVRSDRRWLEFAVRGQREGVASSLSVPMIVGSQVVGAVNLYSSKRDGLDDGSLDRAQQVALQAGGAVALGLRLAEREDGARDAESSLGPQSIIDQAIGIIMARQHVTARAAFEILRTQSYHSRTGLRERAGAVVAEVAEASVAPPRR